MDAPARPVRPQTYGVRPQSHGAPAQTPPAHSVRPAAPEFNRATSGTTRGNTSGHSFFFPKRCFECGSTTHFRHNCPQLRSKNLSKPEAHVKRVSVDILRKDPAPQE